MPKPYILKKSYLNRDNLNRLVKQLTDNANSDREEVLSFLTDIKQRLGNLQPEQTNLMSELLKSAIAALKQVQDVNNTLIKVMSVIQDDVSDTKPSKTLKDKETDKEDLFAGLEKLRELKNGEKA